MFITFEGIDLSGKSTQAQLLVRRLQEEPDADVTGRTVHFLREPGGTPISERLRDILLDRKNIELDPWAELFLFSAARAQLVAEIIRPALRRGESVVCDRFYDSTTAYQGYGRGLDHETVRKINRAATGGTDPDLTIIVDIPVEEIARRRAAAGLGTDRMESAGREFFERVRNGYADIARSEPRRVILVDGTGTVQDIAEYCWRAVARLRHMRQQSVQG